MLKTYQQCKMIDNQLFKEVIHVVWITSFALFYINLLISCHQK